MVWRLYTTRVPDDALTGTDPSASRRIAQLSGSESALPNVAATGSQPGGLQLGAQYRGKLGERLSVELRELLDADAVDDVVFYRVNGDAPEEAYYSAEQSSVGRVRPQSAGAVGVDARLVRKGAFGNYRRAVHAGAQDARQIDHDFGNDTLGYIGVPASVERVTWLSNDKTSQQTATADSTVTAEFGDVDLFDIDAAPADFTARPYLLYDLSPSNAGDVDVAVFDTYGDTETVTINGNSVFAWQAVYQSGHRFVGEIVIETGRIRTTLDATANSLSAERWDTGTSSWASVSLGTADWVLDDVDLVRPGPAHTQAQLTFRATADTTDRSQGDRYPLDAFYHRGWDDVQFAIPPSKSGPIPTDLVTLLDPIASASVVNPEPTRELLAREEVRA